MNEHSWTSEASDIMLILKIRNNVWNPYFDLKSFMKENENHLSGVWNFLMTEMVLEEMRFGEEGGEGMHVTWIFSLQTQCEGCNESICELLGGGHVGEKMLRMWPKA